MINTQNLEKEFLTVLTKDLRLVADLIKGINDRVNMPDYVKKEDKNNNILIACHNYYSGAIIQSLGDVCNAIHYNCQFIAIVAENHIGFLIIEYDLKNHKQLIDDLMLFNGYIDICFDYEKGDEIDKLHNSDISKEEREKLILEIYYGFISDNNLKFVEEFN